MRRLISGIFVMIILVFAIAGRDVKPIDDSDLLLTPLVLADEDNAFIVLKRADELYGELEATASFETQAKTLADNYNHEDAGRFVDHYQSALEFYAIAARLEQAQIPTDYLDINSTVPDLEHLQDLAYASRIYALWLLQSDSRAALEEAMNAVRIANHLNHSGSTVLGNLLAYVMQSLGISSLKTVLEEEVNIESADVLLKELTQLKGDFALESGVRGEYMLQRAAIEDMKTSILTQYPFLAVLPKSLTTRIPYLFLPDQTLNQLAKVDRIVIQDIPFCRLSDQHLAEIEALTKTPWHFKNIIGTTTTAILLPDFNSVLERNCVSEAERQLMRVRLALEVFKQAEGDYPELLELLVPNYLAALPTDPFSGDVPVYDVSARSLSFPSSEASGGSLSILSYSLD